jgi:hypothetical protein
LRTLIEVHSHLATLSANICWPCATQLALTSPFRPCDTCVLCGSPPPPPWPCAEHDEPRLSSCSLPASFNCYSSVEYNSRRLAVGDASLAAVNETAHKVWTTLSATKLRRKRRMSPGVLAILLGDYVEHVAVWAVGACNVAVFLHKCF